MESLNSFYHLKYTFENIFYGGRGPGTAACGSTVSPGCRPWCSDLVARLSTDVIESVMPLFT